MFVNC